MADVSAWIEAHGGLVPAAGLVLDVACGAGANTSWFFGARPRGDRRRPRPEPARAAGRPTHRSR